MVGTAADNRIGDVMRSLHWLPITNQIRFCLLLYAVNNGTSPAYMADTTTPLSSFPGHRSLRFVAANQYEIPRIRSKFGHRLFSVVGPRQWKTSAMFLFLQFLEWLIRTLVILACQLYNYYFIAWRSWSVVGRRV